MKIRAFEPADEPAMIARWEQGSLIRPGNDPRTKIRRKALVRPELFLVGRLDDELIATARVGCDGHRGWINYLAVAPVHQRDGRGRGIMAEAERLLRPLGCPKINLQVRATNLQAVDFYRSVGYTFDEVVSLGNRLEHDGPAPPGRRTMERLTSGPRVTKIGDLIPPSQAADLASATFALSPATRPIPWPFGPFARTSRAEAPPVHRSRAPRKSALDDGSNSPQTQSRHPTSRSGGMADALDSKSVMRVC